jgi:hypothetical protein
MPAYPPPYGPAAPYPQGQPAYGYPPAQPSPAYPATQPPPGYPPAQPAYGYPSVTPYPYPPVPPTPPRKRRVGLIVGLSVTAILVLSAACVGVVVAVNRYTAAHPLTATRTPSSSPTSAPATASPTASPTLPPVTGDLRKLLLPVPAGAKTYTVPVLGTDGTITVQQAAKDNFGDAANGVDRMNAIGFQRGAWVAWTQNNVSTYIELYQFQSPSEAQDWVDALSRAATDDYAAGFDVPDVPRAWCHATKKADSGGDNVVICYASLGYLYVELWHYTHGAPDADATMQLLRQQLALLP